MTRVATLSVFLALTGLACRPQLRHNPIIGEDLMPLDGAMHLSDMGHASAYSGSKDPDDPDPGRHGGAGHDRFGELANALSKSWVHRSIHEKEGVDVEGVLALLRDETADARGHREFKEAVRRATCRLGDGSLQVAERSRGLHSDTGVRIRAEYSAFMIEGTDGRYDKALAPGDLLLSVDGLEVARWREQTCIAPGSTPGQREARLASSLERARTARDSSRDEGPRRAKTITVRRAKSGKTQRVSLKWQPEAETACVEGKALTGDVGIVTVHRFDCTPEAFESQLTSALAKAGTHNVLVDLRRVRTDDWDGAAALARRFVPAGSTWTRTREGTSGAFETTALERAGTPAANAARAWILTSPRCAGACEVAASAMAAGGKVTTAGRATAGSVTDTTAVEIGKKLSVRVPTVQYALPGTSTLIEGKGVTPDLIVTATIDILGRGHDPEVVAIARRIRGE